MVVVVVIGIAVAIVITVVVILRLQVNMNPEKGPVKKDVEKRWLLWGPCRFRV